MDWMEEKNFTLHAISSLHCILKILTPTILYLPRETAYSNYYKVFSSGKETFSKLMPPLTPAYFYSSIIAYLSVESDHTERSRETKEQRMIQVKFSFQSLPFNRRPNGPITGF